MNTKPGSRSKGLLIAGGLVLPCMLGPAGITRSKREGDGATPAGRFALLSAFYRADRMGRPQARLTLRSLRPEDGWCDDPADGRYNQPVMLPLRAGHESMWRGDRLYDLGIVIDYNVRTVRKGRGSAIFLHVMAPAATPTAGCIALRPDDLRRLLPRLSRSCTIRIGSR